jgi:phosphoribosylaminoimidazolecarboxamide formyltransferase/IMP cyclohydrolase
MDGPFVGDAPPLQGKPLSYNNVLDASAAATLGRLLRGPACVVVKHTNPCGAAERATLLEAWEDARAGDPEAAFGGVVATTMAIDGASAEAMTSFVLERGSAGAVRRDGTYRVDHLGAIRSAGGGVLVSAPDDSTDDPEDWAVLASRAPSDRERADLDLAWRLCRGVVSNAIVLVRDGMLVGLGSGQVSRVDACRQAVAKAERFHGPVGARGAVAASDAFFPFPDGPQILLDAGVSAIVQPGGSVRDGEILGAVERAGASMLITGTRHFRH